MNRTQLRREILARGYDEHAFVIDGAHEHQYADMGSVYLAEVDGQFEVGLQERGSRDLGRRFRTEEQACEEMLRDFPERPSRGRWPWWR